MTESVAAAHRERARADALQGGLHLGSPSEALGAPEFVVAFVGLPEESGKPLEHVEVSRGRARVKDRREVGVSGGGDVHDVVLLGARRPVHDASGV
jgi:hypothetical protein